MAMIKNLREIRKAQGMTQESLAKELGVIQASIAHWENGRVNPRTEHLIRLAEILKCSVDQLIS